MVPICPGNVTLIIGLILIRPVGYPYEYPTISTAAVAFLIFCRKERRVVTLRIASRTTIIITITGEHSK